VHAESAVQRGERQDRADYCLILARNEDVGAIHPQAPGVFAVGNELVITIAEPGTPVQGGYGEEVPAAGRIDC
jgi:hypothetical protein